jgi:peptidoglycan-associated lipoprotein
MALGAKRALSVKSYFVSYGVSEDRLETVSYGEERLLNKDCKDDLCHSKNRRVDIKIIGGK